MLKYVFLILAFQSAFAFGCQKSFQKFESIPFRLPASRGVEACANESERPEYKMSYEQILDAFKDENIFIVSGSPTELTYLQEFLIDFRRFPLNIQREMKRKGSRIHLIIGKGVNEDPTWGSDAEKSLNPQDWLSTPDGRDWGNVPGAGGDLITRPTATRIVVNRLKQGHGSVNLFLHEYAHTLDSIDGEYSISKSSIWSETLIKDQHAVDFLSQVCGSYCTNPSHPEEAFAELFAYYHACKASKGHLKSHMPNVAELFERMKSSKDLSGKKR